MYIDIKDENSLSILKIIMEEYKKSNEDVKININNALGSNVEEELKKEKSPDLIFVSRNEMIKLSQKGLLDNMETSYEKIILLKIIIMFLIAMVDLKINIMDYLLYLIL